MFEPSNTPGTFVFDMDGTLLNEHHELSSLTVQALRTLRERGHQLMSAFEKLGANGEKVYIEFDAQMPRENMKIRLYNDKEARDVIELKKFYVKP